MFDALRAGDKTAEKVVKKYTEYLAAGVNQRNPCFSPAGNRVGQRNLRVGRRIFNTVEA